MEKKKQEESKEQLLQLKPIKTRIMRVQIESLPNSTLISHRLDPAVVAEFTNREFGEVEKKSRMRNLDAEYESCFYYTSDKKYGYPVSAFLAAVLDSAVAINIAKTKIKRAMRFLGDITELKYKKVNRRIDNPRRGGRNKTPDVRHRPEFVDWSCELLVQYDESQISPEQIVNLLNYSGFSSGIGDWRPSAPMSSGSHGMYKVKSTTASK